MVKKPNIALGELFGNTEYIKQINISDMINYSRFKIFKPYSDEKLENLAEDIKINGVLSPVILRPISRDGYDIYEILAGHNRCSASRLAGLEKIPAIIKDDISDSDADLIFINTNLNQRDELLPSEKAFAYKLQYEANKNQGKRNDLDIDNFPTNGREVNSKQDNTNISNIDNFSTNGREVNKRQIQRYMRLTYLTKDFLGMVDVNELPFRAGVEISYLSSDEQDLLYRYLIENKIKLSLTSAEIIKKYKTEMNEIITTDILDKIFNKNSQTKPRSLVKTNVVFSAEKYNDYFGNMNKKDIPIFIEKVLEEYFENEKS